jgi:hypothetical protein
MKDWWSQTFDISPSVVIDTAKFYWREEMVPPCLDVSILQSGTSSFILLRDYCGDRTH